MKVLALALAVCSLVGAAPLPEEDDRAVLQGIWHGTGRSAQYTLIFCGDVLIGTVGNHPLLGAQVSGYRAAYGGIDIERVEGAQLGIYQLQGDVLVVLLADVGTPRPISLDVPNAERAAALRTVDRKNRPPLTQQRYVFERAR